MGSGISSLSLSAYFVTLLLLLLLGLAVFKIFGTPLKLLAMLIFNSLLGFGALLVLKFILEVFGIAISVSVFSSIVVGLLGIPGLILIIILNILL